MSRRVPQSAESKRRSAGFRIEKLAEHPEAIATLAAWEHAEWGHVMPDVSLDQILRAFERRANRDRIPMTLLGYVDDQLVGTASLVVHDLETRRDLSPWVAIVYVDPEYRGRGFGSALVRASMREAANLGIERAYLFTPDQMSFYARLGWTEFQILEYRGETVTIMECRTIGDSV